MNRHINFHGKVRRYNHNLSYRNYFSGEIGEMRPIWLEDGVPGDTFQYTPEVRAYFAPLVFPVLSRMKCRVDTFFVPARLCWSEFENFITGGSDGSLSPAYPSVRHVRSSITDSNILQDFDRSIGTVSSARSLLNNLGHPVMSNPTLSKDPFDLTTLYSYLFIWDEYYRDEEKEPNSITGYGGIHRDIYDIWTSSSISSLVYNRIYQLPSIAWAKDYFTSASLHQQRGADIPLLSGNILSPSNPQDIPDMGTYLSINATGTDEGGIFAQDADANPILMQSTLTVNGLRYLKAASAWFNNNVVGGTRYIEQLRNRYHVVSSDARLQRPEMIGSSEITVNIDIVTQTSSTVDDGDVQALGDRAGKASIVGRGKTLTYSCEEFGWFISIMHIAPRAAYFQGIRRNLQREDRFDFFQPELQGLPQQEIRNNEIFCDNNTMEPETGGTFGWTGIFNELKHHNDEVHGDFTGTLLAWTMARKFSSLPSAASSSFLRVDHDTSGNNRIFAVPDSDYNHIFGVANNIIIAKRLVMNKEPKF